MSKPKKQSEELRRAKFEFIKRNREENQKLKELCEKNKKEREAFLTTIATLGEELDPEIKKEMDFLFQDLVIDEKLKKHLKKTFPKNAVNSVWRWPDYCMEIGHQKMTTPASGTSNQLSYEELKNKVIDMHCRDAKEIFEELMDDRPAVHLLLSIDLTRSKSDIEEEVKNLIDEYKTKLGVHEVKEKRFKWLSNLDKMLAVWDMRMEGKTFAEIADIQGIKGPNAEDTVKKRFYLVFQLISGRPYDKHIWKKLFFERLEKFALSEGADNPKIWEKLLKRDTGYQRESTKRQDFWETAGEEDTQRLFVMIDDISKICRKCPDMTCRNQMISRLADMKKGDNSAFEDFRPDCPKIHEYLTS